MRRLAAVERALERLFERSSARLFGLRIQPVQVLRRVERAMEGDRRTVAGRTLVPERIDIHLNPTDLAAFKDLAEAVAAELADGALAFARAHHYAVQGRPRVTLRADAGVANGDVAVTAAFGAPPASDNADDGQTRVYRAPRIEAPGAILRVVAVDGSSRQIAVDGRRLTIGRADDNGLVLADLRVSRHHARINVRRRALVLVDLGSTNGVRVNGVRVSEVALGAGDRIELGETVLVVEEIAEAPPTDGLDPLGKAEATG